MNLGNSATSAVRITVLLACMVVIPAIAVFGTLSPKGMLSVVEARWSARMGSAEAAADGQAGGPDRESPDAALAGGSERGMLSDHPVAEGRAEGGQAAASGVGVTSGGDAQLLRLQQRLRAMGATYCRLETWGNGGDLYRFHCRVGVGGSSGFSRHFEATDADPLQAIAKVAAEVESSTARR